MINPEKIKQLPSDILAHLMEENNNLHATVEDKATDLYDAMSQRLAHTGKVFTDIGKKQQHRNLTQMK